MSRVAEPEESEAGVSMLKMTEAQAAAHQKRVQNATRWNTPVPETLLPAKPNKYGAKKVFADGITFDSKKEYEHYLVLRADKTVKDLRVHVPIDAVINGVKVFTYKVDFLYVQNGKKVYVDVKGMRSGCAYAIFRVKAKVIAALLGINVEEV